VFAALLRRLTASGFRRGLTGSTPWLIIGILATGIRILRRLSIAEEEVLYRTAIKAGDVFEIVTRPPQQ
jgi:hypothetical protein